LVAKGFTHKELIDYEETLLSVTMLKFIRTLLSIVAHFDYEIWEMDVTIVLLNGYLDEDIYMMQPGSFVAKSHDQWHASCKSPFMDFNKYLGHGTYDLIRKSNRLVLIKTLMSHVSTRCVKIK
jgi:hypothetical protein